MLGSEVPIIEGSDNRGWTVHSVHHNIIVSVQYSHIHVHRAKWVKFNGMHLKPGVVVVLSPYVQSTDSLEFGSISEVFMLPCKGVFLGVKVYEVSDYNEHLGCQVHRHESSIEC